MILIPLLYPEALPKTAMLSAPAPPAPKPPSPPAAMRVVKAAAPLDAFTAAARIPGHIDMTHDDPPPAILSDGFGSMAGTVPGGLGVMASIGAGASPPVVRVAPPKKVGPVNISSGVVAGNRLSGSDPVYPAIAKAVHVSGAVVLRAIISKTGTIQSLQVISGPEMLRSSAVAAVQAWRYRPYLLNGEPTEVDTTITVNFYFGG